jgi:hypothetical protein
MRNKLWTSLFVAGLTIGGALAQQTPPQSASPKGHIVRIRSGSYAGFCNPCVASETIIEPRSITTISRSFSDKRTYPDVKLKRKITKEDWEDLQHSIDATVLATFIGRMGCPGGADELVEWVEVQFSDGTKKSVSYNEGGAPLAIGALVQKIKAIGESRLPQQKPYE